MLKYFLFKRQYFYFYIIIHLLIILIPKNIFAVEPITIDKNTLNQYPIGLHLELLEDKENRLTIDDITGKDMKKSIQWLESKKESPAFGHTYSTYWLRFTVLNPSYKEIEWYLENDYPLMDYIDLYIPDGEGKFKIKKYGDQLPFSSRDIDYRSFIFSIKEAPKSSRTYYIRCKTTSSMNLQFRMMSPKIFTERTKAELPILWIYYGLLISMIIYNLFLFFSVRDYSYLYYVLYVAFYMLLQMALNGLAFQYIWPDILWWQNYCIPLLICFTFASGTQFARLFMRTYKIAKNWDKVFLIVIALCGVGIIIVAVDFPFGVRFGTIINICALFHLIVSVILSIKGSRQARFYLLSWIFFIVGVLAFVLKSLGILSANFITNWSIQIGSSFQFVLLAIALSDQINTMKSELEIMNKDLEKRVEERTEELQSAMEELQVTNVQLVETRDALWGEMELAKKIQTVLLPEEPEIKGMAITAFMKPADEVGGDYYDIINIDGMDWLVIGDVSGHGVPAGLIMMMVQTAIHVALIQNPKMTPSELLVIINRAISENIKKMNEDKYMTITVFAVLQEGKFVFSGLHQDIMIYRAESHTVELVETDGIWIGLMMILKEWYGKIV